MKLRITLSAVVAAIVIAVFAPLFSTCDDRVLYPVLDLTLTYLKVGDMVVTVIPAPISEEDWEDEEYEPANSDSGVIVVKDWDLESVTIKATANRNALVTWGQSKGGARPARFNNLNMPTTIERDDLFFFRLEDPEAREIKYFRFIPMNARAGKELFNLTVAGRDPDFVPTSNADMDELVDKLDLRGTVFITRGEAIKALVAATPQDDTARIRYAVATSLTAARNGQFSEFWVDKEEDKGKEDESKPKVVVVQDEQGKNITQTHATITFTDGNILAVEVMAQNDDVNYFAFQVYSERLAVINKLTIGGKTVTGKGTEHGVWGNVVPGSFDSADQPSGGFKIGITLEDREGSAEWAVVDNTLAAQNTASFTPGLSGTRKFNDSQVLVIKVNSPRLNGGDAKYYKIQMNLLAANFKKHPKSAAYEIKSHTYPTTAIDILDKDDNVVRVDNRILTTAQGARTLDRAIAPLTFTLDRKGNFTYQWYTANSWYGGYGFDQDNNIAFDPAVKTDGGDTKYDPATNTILDKDYFPNPFAPDEKGNISLHNGGNQYYRLPYNGMPIAGATQSTYTPTIDARNRPFITGFSNQTQYYWVVVTDDKGLKAVSDRAAIVSEWGEEFNMGVPTGNKVTKKHHIVDTHAYMDGGIGLKSNPRNPTAFKAGNHGDEYHIPITFPSGFSVKDYSVITCQALFYLSDGRPWIQNWTQGDFGFSDADKGKIVLWYNLTNDNATRGLGSSGNEPSGGGLDVLPAHLVVQPAGTKPMKELPPFSGKDRDGRDNPVNTGDAQGWFTPYIEIVELRLEGPSR